MKFSKSSIDKLNTCHEDLQILAKEAIKDSPYDFKITHGHRTPEKQFELFKKGRKLDENNKWIIIGNIVTYVDGYNKKSKHNENPSLAFDIAILQNGRVTWSIPLYIELAGYILEVADNLFEQNIIKNRITWGGQWRRLKDWCHFQI